jgi:surface antigen
MEGGEKVRILFRILLVAAIAAQALFSGSAVAETNPDPTAYPYKNSSHLCTANEDCVPDIWGFFQRECTSFVAWRLNDAGIRFHNNYDGVGEGRDFSDASNWLSAAQRFGIPYDNSPSVGSVAWWSSNHVAWVSAVDNQGYITIEEYNKNFDGNWSTRTIPASSVQKYIHFQDLPTTNPYPGYGPKLASMAFQDGRLAVFYVGADNAIYYQQQDAPGGAWPGQEHRIPAHVKAVAVTASYDSRIELFAIGQDNAVYHWWQQTPGEDIWLGPNRYAANVYSLAAARSTANLVELYAVGHGDADVYRLTQTSPNSWVGSAWVNMPANVWEIAATTSHDGRNELFMVGHDNALWHRWQTSPGGAWSADEMQAAVISKLAAGRNQDGRLEVFALGPDNKVYNKWQQQPGTNWSGWGNGLQASGKSLAVGRNADGRLELFVVGGDNRVWHLWQQTPGGNWSGAVGLNGRVAA